MSAMETNVKVLGWLYIVLGILGVIIGAIVLFILLGTGIVAQDGEAMAILFIVGVIVAGLMTVLSLPGIVTGWGCSSIRVGRACSPSSWARSIYRPSRWARCWASIR